MILSPLCLILYRFETLSGIYLAINNQTVENNMDGVDRVDHGFGDERISRRE